MKIRATIAVSSLLVSCGTKPVQETPVQTSPVSWYDQSTTSVVDGTRAPANAETPRYAFKGDLGEFAKALSDPANLKQSVALGNRYDYMAKNNLHDTGVDAGDAAACAGIMKNPHRTADGRCYYQNQKFFADKPNVGANQARFGRNSRPMETAKVTHAVEKLLEPNPRLISKELLERKDGKFIPVPTLNLFAAAWLQMENHDWFSHGKNVMPAQGAATVQKHGAAYQKYFDLINIPAVPGDSLFPNGMQIPRTRPDLSSQPRNGYALTYRNVVTHWWDASHIYGSDAEAVKKIRTNPDTGAFYPGGLIAVDEANRRLYYENGVPVTGFHDNWWVGLELLHTTIAMEHNAVARMLKTKHPQLSDDDIFEKSRLVISALLAKIHTVEWTPALLDNQIGHIGMYANWYGLKKLKNKSLKKIVATLSKNFSQTLNGLTGPGALDPQKTPFTLTEEFVAVYRMHPLLPDIIQHRSPDNPLSIRPLAMQNSTFEKAGEIVGASSHASRDMVYSFLTSHPGALTVNNFPKFLQPITVQRNTDGVRAISLEMGTVDVLRDRERLVPRYNEFRRQLGLKTIKTFSDLTPDKEVIEKLERIYGGDVEMLDLQIGSLAENDRLKGFAFGVTPFSIFQLMASRRLMADPFFTEYFTPEVYTQEGLNWVNNTSFSDMVSRHFPEFKEKLRNVVNGFHPWNE